MRRISKTMQVLVMLLAGVALIVLILVLARPDDAPGLTAQILPSPKQDGGFPYPLPEITGKLATAPPRESAYPPPAPTPTGPTPFVTPWPTSTPFPTKEPPPPVPTPQPTPVVTPFPVATPPFIPGLEDVAPQPFHIIIREGNRVSIMNDDGTDERLLIDTEEKAGLYLGHYPLQGIEGPPLRWGSVSPDGARLALAVTDVWKLEHATQFFDWQIYLFDTQTEELRFLVEGREPVWSPDGSRIAYIRNSGLYVVDPASNEATELFAASEGFWVREVAWSPDGQRIAFVHEMAGAGASPELWVAHANGSGERVRLDVPDLWLPEGVAWTPDGESILFINAEIDSATAQVLHDLLKLNLGSGDLDRMTTDTVVASFALRPQDGAWIALASTHPYEKEGSRNDLWMLGADKARLYRITRNEVSDREPQWSPDESQIIFRRIDEGIWVLDLVDGNLKQVHAEAVDFAVTG